jgi:hypothetical protein
MYSPAPAVRTAVTQRIHDSLIGHVTITMRLVRTSTHWYWLYNVPAITCFSHRFAQALVSMLVSSLDQHCDAYSSMYMLCLWFVCGYRYKSIAFKDETCDHVTAGSPLANIYYCRYAIAHAYYHTAH